MYNCHFAALGALDRIFGNRFGLGDKFEEGIRVITELAISMVGILVLAPVLTNVLKPVIVPLFECLGAEPAMFVGMIWQTIWEANLLLNQ